MQKRVKNPGALTARVWVKMGFRDSGFFPEIDAPVTLGCSTTKRPVDYVICVSSSVFLPLRVIALAVGYALRALATPLVIAVPASISDLAVLFIVAFIAGFFLILVFQNSLEYTYRHGNPSPAPIKCAMAGSISAVTPKTQDPEDQLFTSPDKSGAGTFESPIYSLNKSELKTLCGDLNLKVSGNMLVLRTRLKEYSEQPSEWEKHGPIVRRKHKGARKAKVEGSESKKKSLLEERMEELRPSTAVTSRPTERSKDTRTEKQKEDHLPWAERVCAMFPDYQTPRNSVSKLALQASPKEDKINAKLDAIQTQLDNIAKIGTTTRPAFTSESEPFASVLHSQDSLSDIVTSAVVASAVVASAVITMLEHDTSGPNLQVLYKIINNQFSMNYYICFFEELQCFKRSSGFMY
ncbi:hypothetical protein K435DRAFT_790898 [Dendrothele bispora CBS 962.96]|uniref:SAP domain-containing protein n=1 Tax=Dendrothele bispora (strain CBS 962.96) TaxID=1314807 RepID=A0A4S8MNI1_DENBC|nr:hypothetical protein K435DRAFT_790898 [Dendrothele bispora CBS 962.96]